MQEKVKIISVKYRDDLDFAKVTVQKLNDNETGIFYWGLTGDSFDALINQIINKNFKYSKEQRKEIALHIKNITLINNIKVDFTVDDMKKIKEVGPEKYHMSFDQYPFYEIQQEMLEDENTND